MKYLLTYHVDGTRMADMDPEAAREALERWSAFDAEAVEAGVMIAEEPLREAAAATTVTLDENGEAVVTDGPFTEAKEQLGGFALLECADLDEALGWAKKVPMRDAAVQVSPVRDFSDLGYESPTPPPLGARA